MSINEHLTEFAGLPVVEFRTPEIDKERLLELQERAEYQEEPVPDRLPPDPAADAAYAAALADPGSVAWRLRLVPEFAEEPFDTCFARFLDEVDTTRVTALIVGCWGEESDEPASIPRDLLVEHADRFPALRALFLGEMTSEENELSWIVQCDVVPLLAVFAALEELVVRGGDGLEFPATRHSSLRGLVVQTGGLPREVTAGILASDLPALEHLELWFGVADYGGTTRLDDLEPLLAGKLFPALRRLGLRNSEWGDELVGRLAGAPVVQRVRVLDLSGHVLTDEGGQVLATAPVFRNLERLVIHHHFLSEPVMARLREALPGVEVDLSEPEEPDTYKDRVYYYPEAAE